MKWYPGGIVEAISASKIKGAIFVVYLEGSDEQSRKLSDLINEGELGEELEKDHFVAIKVEAGSVAHQQFGEIYKEPSIPSIYFIGKAGVPLDIITGNDKFEDLTKRINTILSKAGFANTSSNNSAASSESLIKGEQSAATNSSNVVCENGVCTLPKTETPASSDVAVENEDKKGLSPEEKVQHAKELLEHMRLKKENEEKENEHMKEIERRKMGQDMQQRKKWQEDMELKQLKEERDKEKKENQLARERVLAQIAQDKAERLAKSQSQPSESLKPVMIPSLSKAKSNTTRLQFRLPDGSSNTQDFASSDSLQTVISYIKSNIKLSFSNFTLSTMFPRREFTSNDYSQSLLDLQLTPNAVILILPLNHGAVTTNPGGTFTALIWSLFTPLLNLFGYLKSFIFGGSNNSSNNSTTNKSTSINKRPPEESGEIRPDYSKRIMRDSTVIRRQGNIHRLGDRRDSDDEGNTWNGNSTQQM